MGASLQDIHKNFSPRLDGIHIHMYSSYIHGESHY